MEIVGRIYGWFEGFFGQNLGEYLWGYDCASGDYTGINQYNTIGLITFLVAALMMVFYYYWPLNHSRFNRWWSWLIMLLVTGILNLFIGFGMIYSDFLNGMIPDCLVYNRDESGEIAGQFIDATNCWGFGIANAFFSILIFILLSICFKWWSRNCKQSPF